MERGYCKSPGRAQFFTQATSEKSLIEQRLFDILLWDFFFFFCFRKPALNDGIQTGFQIRSAARFFSSEDH